VAFLRIGLLLLLMFSGASTVAAHMGRTIAFLAPEGHLPELAGYVVASYIGEQMGRDMDVSTRETSARCLDSILHREAPMALIPETDWNDGNTALVRAGDFRPVGGVVFVLVMGEEAAGNLQFSLVDRYLAKLSEGLNRQELEDGSERVRDGEGPRKVALDLLREADLI